MRTRVRASERFKVMECRVCGCAVSVGSNTRNAPRCVECGVKAYEESAHSMASHSGQAWQAWLAGYRAFLDRL